MALSGTLAQIPFDKPSQPVAILSGPCALVNQTCVTSPDATSNSSVDCVIGVMAPGYITAPLFNLESYADKIIIDNIVYEFGSPRPQSQRVYKGSVVRCEERKDEWGAERATWKLCWSAHPPIQTLSVARNRFEGTADALYGLESLHTVLVSGNYLSCDVPNLEAAVGLARGKSGTTVGCLTLVSHRRLHRTYRRNI